MNRPNTNDTYMASLMLELSRLRVRQGRTQAYVAGFVGVAASTLCNWEARRNFPNLGQAVRIAEALGARLDIKIIPAIPSAQDQHHQQRQPGSAR